MNCLEISNSKSNFLAAQTLSPVTVSGEVMQLSLTYRARFEWDGQTLKGRLGGLVFGEDLLLEFGPSEALGWVSGMRVFSVHAQLEGRRVELRLAGVGIARSGSRGHTPCGTERDGLPGPTHLRPGHHRERAGDARSDAGD